MADILIIDDEEMVRLTLRETLELAGHTVREATDGALGLQALAEQTPDLVISDLIMPNKEGVETIAEIRQAHPRLPIIAISGGGRIGATDFLEVAKNVGANRTISKPFDPDDLVEIVDAVIAAADGAAARQT